jgi:hypothetical protein
VPAINLPLRGQDIKKHHISEIVVTGFKKIKFQNNQVTINYSGRTNAEIFVILTEILRNVTHVV